MTCIAAVTHRGRVWMAGDSAASTSSVKFSVVPKVSLHGDLVVGYAGEWASPVIANIDWTRDWDVEIHKQTKRRNLEPDALTLMIGRAGSLWHWVAGALYQLTDRYSAIGSGESMALGALYATAGLHPEERVRLAVRAAAKHCPSVGGRITVVSTPKT